ncbi:hypothetical protein GA0061099_1004294 [Bradyrhizobium yuanmingense]|uniref:Uncharacterized protein n=1 Tax=Bradyrhizobium yuanmingense TaxID=108015 RepID=A0A1C3VNA2_9BRAD|nr:hypothetical protein IQ15_02053 [Bradyrhizobium yuanmingense]SCB29281.1 hypothetical protein GA0061099_1004294 [Bradyrhizobium yuanmingense]
MSPTSSAIPCASFTDFRDEIKAVVNGANIAGMDSTDRVRAVAKTVDELLWLMKPRAAIEWPAIDLRLGRILRSESGAV